ncbi:OmpH family outer membrane protein [Cetobacterium sp. 8H]|uniref:OmpH family outer membrane protein n=1 Tax=Cetobacterium sp. 8H TaxID=2759681 RepID=UPI00163BFB91|nr:OmpH family outer membrane protein [Cetobacterium sp. 8H]MBC2851433.1 OmpH family outer membrane protein [Cetobacterium sp. 8H]
MKILFLLFFMSTSIFAINIGVIDSEYIFSQYNKRFEMEEKLENKRISLNSEIEKLRQELLEKEKVIKSKKTITEADKTALLDLKKQFQDKIEASEKDFELEQQNFIYDIKFEIDSVAILIGKQKNLEMVIEKSATIYGGVDLTEDVINFLNNKDSYKLDTTNLLKKQM